MGVKPGRLTRQERMFAQHMADTGDKRYAAEKAGYAVPVQTADKMVKKPHVMAEVARLQTQRLYNDALPAAVDCLISILTDTKAPAGARVQASKVVLDRTLGAQEGAQAKEPHEMTGEELARAIEQLDVLEAEALKRAKPVNSIEPDSVFA